MKATNIGTVKEIWPWDWRLALKQLGLHVLWAVGNSLQRQGFDAAGLKTTVHENNNHATPSSCP